MWSFKQANTSRNSRLVTYFGRREQTDYRGDFKRKNDCLKNKPDNVDNNYENRRTKKKTMNVYSYTYEQKQQ